MIEISYGDNVEATCKFDYAGPARSVTLAQEIGTIITGAPLPEATWLFNTLDRWELPNVSIVQGANTKVFTFKVVKVSGLNQNTVYDMNFEIGSGSKQSGNWQLLKRVFVNDIIKIMAGAALFSNLSVSYRKL